jgi:ClpA/ClpB-like protein
MFERFTQDARRVVVLAQEEARLLNHDYIGTEHVLLGLIQEGEGVAARALKALDVSLEQVRAEVQEMVGEGQGAPVEHIPFTPRAKKVLELSLREALQMGHNYIGTAHILLGVVREGEGVGARILVKLTPGLQKVREQVLQVLATTGGGAEDEPQAAQAARSPIAAVVGGPGAYQEQEPAELVRVVPLAREVFRGAGYRLVLISLEIWSGWLDLRYAMLPAEPAAPTMPEAAVDWRVTDDAGTDYQLAGAASSSGRLLRIHQLTFRPAPSERAGTLTLTVTDGDEGARPLAVVQIDLPGQA